MATSTEQTIALLKYVLRLKRLPRTGWLLAGIALPESVADHSFGTAFLACVLGELVNSAEEDVPGGQPVDLGRVARMALVHDLAESIVTDLPRQAAEVIGREAKHAAERAALEIIFDGDTDTDCFASLFQEYEQGVTAEAQLVRDADKLDMVMQAQEYASRGNTSLDEFWQGHNWNFVQTRQLFDHLRLGNRNGSS